MSPRRLLGFVPAFPVIAAATFLFGTAAQAGSHQDCACCGAHARDLKPAELKFGKAAPAKSSAGLHQPAPKAVERKARRSAPSSPASAKLKTAAAEVSDCRCPDCSDCEQCERCARSAQVASAAAVHVEGELLILGEVCDDPADCPELAAAAAADPECPDCSGAA